MALRAKTTFVGRDKDGDYVWSLPTGNYFGGEEFDTAEKVDDYLARYPQQTGMRMATYVKQYGPITK